MNSIPVDVLTILHAITTTGNNAYIPTTVGQLDRTLYEQVDEVLRRLGGAWKGGRIKAHVFPYDPAPLLAAVLETGEMPPKNPHAFFPTPRLVIDGLFLCADLDTLPNDARILEPSAGQGAILDALRERGFVADAVELNPLNAQVLRDKAHTVIYEGSFLDYNPGPIYDCAVMNPPFSVEGDKTAWMTHIRHAWSLLKNEGVLAAITPASLKFRDDAAHDEMRAFIGLYGGFEDIGAGAFKDSGTGVATCYVYLRKSDQAWRERSYNGWDTWYAWCLMLHIDNTAEQRDEYEKLMDCAASDGFVAVEPRVRVFFDTIARRARAMGDPVILSDNVLDEALRHFCDEAGVEMSVRTKVVSLPPSVREPETLLDLIDMAA